VRKVVVLGNTGAGKTTFGVALAQRLGVPHVDSDDLLWRPGWEEASQQDFRAALDAASSEDGWVISGTYLARGTDITWPRADTLVWLDPPLRRVLHRSVRRTVRRSLTGELVCNGNREHLRFLLPKPLGPDTPLWLYAIGHHRKKRPQIESMLRDVDATVHRLRSRAEVSSFLEHTAR